MSGTALPRWSWAIPAAAFSVGLLVLSGALAQGSAIAVLLSTPLLGGAVFAAVLHAEILAARVGEPFGSLILALAVTVMEVALIVSLMLSGAEGSAQVARDTVFSAIMIVLNGVIGISLLVGAGRFHEQSFRLDAASGALAVLGVLATVGLVLPNFVIAGGAQQFAPLQLAIIGVVSLGLYAAFIFVQTVRHRDYFLGEAVGIDSAVHDTGFTPELLRKIAPLSGALLLISLIGVILLAKTLSYPLDSMIAQGGLPQTFVGVVIAMVILLPEGIASIRAAVANQLQNSINLVLGSALASIGMTIPAVAALSVFMGLDLVLGLSPAHSILLLLTLFAGSLTLGTGRTTVLQGAVHLSIFAIFILLSAVP